jgi:hypothetical protein
VGPHRAESAGQDLRLAQRRRGRLEHDGQAAGQPRFAESFDWAEPAGYGLGRSGWITARFGPDDELELDLLKRWIAESYRAVAPKKLGKLLPE